MQLDVVVPVYNGGSDLERCLTAVAASRRPADRVIVVDDGSTDGAAAAARDRGFDVLRLDDGPHGPATARNRGAARSAADVLVFFDADVVVHPETIGRIEEHFTSHSETAALFGSYDAEPPASGSASRYKNLLHHYMHQTGQREATTFWAGCGAVRRDAFQAVGGFDESYASPSIEDIELGARLRRAGLRIRLCPEIQVTHLKRWTLWSLVRTDILCRAVPWTRLLLRDGALPNDLNLGWRHRASAIAAVLMIVALVLTPWLPVASVVLVAGGAFVLLNLGMLRFLRRRGGFGFAIAAGGIHAIYGVYSTCTFALIGAQTVVQRLWARWTHPLRSRRASSDL